MALTGVTKGAEGDGEQKQALEPPREQLHDGAWKENTGIERLFYFYFITQGTFDHAS